MNARAIKKRLMRARSGYRAYLTVRLPLSLAGDPPPDIRKLLPAGFEDDVFEGEFRKTSPTPAPLPPNLEDRTRGER